MVSVKNLITFLTRFNNVEKKRAHNNSNITKNINSSSQLFRRSLLVTTIVSTLGVASTQAQETKETKETQEAQ